LNAIAPISIRPQAQRRNAASASGTGRGVAEVVGEDDERQQRQDVNHVYRKMSATAWTLRHVIGTTLDLKKVICAYPSVLLLDAETQILPAACYLMNDLGIYKDDLPRVLQLYPALLGMSVDDMKRVPSYLLSLDVAQENLASIFRAFPSLLTLNVETDIVPVITFLQDIGISNIGRFVTYVVFVCLFLYICFVVVCVFKIK
jgi:hypothetical protein